MSFVWLVDTYYPKNKTKSPLFSRNSESDGIVFQICSFLNLRMEKNQISINLCGELLFPPPKDGDIHICKSGKEASEIL